MTFIWYLDLSGTILFDEGVAAITSGVVPSQHLYKQTNKQTNKQTLLFQITNMRMCAGRHASWCWDCWCLTGTFFIMVMLRSVGECPSRHCKGRHTTTHPCHNRMGANIFCKLLIWNNADNLRLRDDRVRQSWRASVAKMRWKDTCQLGLW